MAEAVENELRVKAVLMARRYKALFAGAVLPRRWLYRWLLRGENGDLRQVGELVLQDLIRFTGVRDKTLFDRDPLVLAYWQGRRDVMMRIINFLNLDEATVQQIMEIDNEW